MEQEDLEEKIDEDEEVIEVEDDESEEDVIIIISDDEEGWQVQLEEDEEMELELWRWLKNGVKIWPPFRKTTTEKQTIPRPHACRTDKSWQWKFPFEIFQWELLWDVRSWWRPHSWQAGNSCRHFNNVWARQTPQVYQSVPKCVNENEMNVWMCEFLEKKTAKV